MDSSVAQQWFVNQSGKSVGPISTQELRQWASDGRLRPLDRVSPDGQRWKIANQIKGLTFREEGSTNLTLPTLIARSDVQEPSQEWNLPGYSVQERIGSGGCGVVYRATHLSLNRVVALKSIRLDASTSDIILARFDREAVAMAKLQHPNIVSVYDYGRHEGRVYIAMELLEGEDLEQRIKRLGPLDEATAWNLARQTAVALEYATHLGIVHRDIKPANLFLSNGYGLHPDSPMVKVLDFGLAFTKRTDLQSDADRLTHNGTILGTPAYMAPEQFQSPDVDHRADIYALGATLFHALAGHPPFEGPTVWDVMQMKGKSAGKLPKLVSPESAALVSAMLAPNPADRIGDYRELIQRIDALLTHRAIPALAPFRKSTRRRVLFWTILGIAATTVVGASVIGLIAGRAPRFVTGPPPTVLATGHREILSDRAKLPDWEITGKMTFEPDQDGAPILTTSGAVRWIYEFSEADRLSIGLDPFKADFVELKFGESLGLRISRVEGVTLGYFRTDDSLAPFLAPVPFPTPESREGLVPYLSIELLRVGDRWDVWFDHRHLGGIKEALTRKGALLLKTSGRPVRVERIELEHVRPHQ